MQLANKYGVSEKTIRRDLEEIRYIRKAFRYKDVTIQMDTTYWGRGFGLMVIRDAVRGKVLWHKLYITRPLRNMWKEWIGLRTTASAYMGP